MTRIFVEYKRMDPLHYISPSNTNKRDSMSSITIMPQPLEGLFLDLVVAEVANRTAGMKTVEPWASMYCNAVSERRYGDAIYARYNIDGRSKNGTFLDTNHTVEEEIKIDAVNYYTGYPDVYAEALSFYANNSDTDTRPEIIEAIRQVASSSTEAKE